MSQDIGNFNPPSRNEFPDAPEWIDRYIKPLNAQVAVLTAALQGGIDARHENADLRDVEVRHGVPTEITTTKVKGRPVGLLLLLSGSPTAGMAVESVDVGVIRLTVYFAAPIPAGEVPIKVKILGGIG